MTHNPNQKNKEIRAAIKYALSRGWQFEKTTGKGHAWGKIFCPHHHRDGCRFTIFGTPAIPEAHARDLRRTVDRFNHVIEERP